MDIVSLLSSPLHLPWHLHISLYIYREREKERGLRKRQNKHTRYNVILTPLINFEWEENYNQTSEICNGRHIYFNLLFSVSSHFPFILFLLGPVEVASNTLIISLAEIQDSLIKRTVLGLTRNCIWLWGSDSVDLESVGWLCFIAYQTLWLI